MRKNLIIMILSMLPLLLHASSYETNFEISAYKFTEESINMNVYDTLSGSLKNLGSSSSDKINDLDITDYISALLYDDEAAVNNNRNSAFGIIVIGNEHIATTEARSYTLSLSLSSMKNIDDQDIALPIYYVLGNNEVTHTGSSGDIVTTTSVKGAPGIADGSTPLNLSHTWTIKRASSNAPNNVSWESRCIVAIAISREDYSEVPIGSYSADIVVTLEVD